MGLSVSELERVKYLQNSMQLNVLSGNYKNYKEAHKEYASLAVKDFNTVKLIKSQPVAVSLFSKTGFNILYVAIRNFFRIKSSDEKLLKQKVAEDNCRNKFHL